MICLLAESSFRPKKQYSQIEDLQVGLGYEIGMVRILKIRPKITMEEMLDYRMR